MMRICNKSLITEKLMVARANKLPGSFTVCQPYTQLLRGYRMTPAVHSTRA